METTVTVKETTLTDKSKVYDVILDHYQGHIEFSMVDGGQADAFSGDLLEVLRKHGFITV
ncbi:MAG TPA: hypothetical protein DCZ63_02215 [Geobacter sp.]|nr:hypothetical protein [Geobacter sp.]